MGLSSSIVIISRYIIYILIKLNNLCIYAAILAYSRETKFFYAYYVVKTLAAIAGEGSFNCLALAYVVFHNLINLFKYTFNLHTNCH